MGKIIVPSLTESREALGQANTWPEAQIIAEPHKTTAKTGPEVLVKRRQTALSGPHDEEMVFLPGLPTISIFTGCGGMDIGIERTGFCTLVQHERDEMCCKTLIGNRPNFFRHAALIQGDIRETPTSMLLREAGLRVGETALLCGGPPCQGFSTANVNRGKKPDERNNLVWQFLRVVKEAQPQFFIMENVPGFLTLHKGAFFHEFLPRAYDCYYELVYGLIDCCEYGVPQYRCRFLCMGTRRDLWEIEGKLGSLPKPQCFNEKDLAQIQQMEGRPLFEHELNLLTHAPGIRYFPDRPILTPPPPVWQGGNNHEKAGRRRSFVEFYRKLHAEEPDRIVTQPAGGDSIVDLAAEGAVA